MARFQKDFYDRVPELSLRQFIDGSANDKKEFSDALWEGFRFFGFIILKDHPIEVSLLQRAYGKAKQLFDLSVDAKMKYAGVHGGQRGYTPFGTEHAKNNRHPDLKEFWHVGREVPPTHRFTDVYPANVWPTEVADFETTFLDLYDELDRTGQIMLRALTSHLDVAPDFFQRMSGEGNTILRLLHYPPIPSDADPRCLRAAAHEDINLITLLVAASTSGLELLDRNGQWLPVETAANNIIVDAGDMLARITNEVIPATTHRVVNPTGPNLSRYSMPFFVHPNPDATLECIKSCEGEGAKYPPVNAQAFLMQRLKEIGLTK